MQSLNPTDRIQPNRDHSTEHDLYSGLAQILEKPMIELDSRGTVTSYNSLFQQACLEEGLDENKIRSAIIDLFSDLHLRPRGAFGIEIKFQVGMYSIKRRARVQFMSIRGQNSEHWIGILQISNELKDRLDISEIAQSHVYSARLAAVAEMSSGIAHEINNPLTVVLAKSHLIEKIISGLDQPEAVTILAAVKKISTHAQRISKIIKGLRNFSRDDTGDPMKIFNVVDSLEECVTLSTERFKARGIRLYVDIKEKEMFVSGRDYQISQIIINLLNNAYDAIDKIDLPEVHITAFNRGENIIVQCCDNGPGVSHEVEQKIMLPFFTTKPTGMGTGLGLSISLGIAKVHGGSLCLNRDVSNSCFELSLPAKSA